MGIPTYVAVLCKNKNLLRKVEKLQLIADGLYEETRVQKKVIDQYKKLLECYSQPNKITSLHFCDRRHIGCRVDHTRYGLVRKTHDHVRFKAPSLSLVTSHETKVKYPSLKKMSKFVDLFQAKYGLPSSIRDKVLVALPENSSFEAKPPISAFHQSKRYSSSSKTYILWTTSYNSKNSENNYIFSSSN